MKQRRTNRKVLRRRGQGLLVILMAFALCVLAVGSPARADITGIVGGFALGDFPSPFLNGATEYTEGGLDAFHMWSSFVTFDPDTRSASGGGYYSIYLDGGTVLQGKWEVRKFKRWTRGSLCGTSATCLSAGPFAADAFPRNFITGKVVLKIALLDHDGAKRGNAKIIIYCSLPGLPYAGGVEQFKVFFDGMRFDIGNSPTVFIDNAVDP